MANDKSTEEPVSSDDSDDVYYRFGGAAICTMLKHRYKELRRCSSATRNALSIEICMLQAMKLKINPVFQDICSTAIKGTCTFHRAV